MALLVPIGLLMSAAWQLVGSSLQSQPVPIDAWRMLFAATVLAMMAVGAGAQQSIEDQVRAAGLNQITIRAGNWKPKSVESDEPIAHQGDARESLKHPLDRIKDDVVKASFHPEGMASGIARR